jgi:hypothetical protein
VAKHVKWSSDTSALISPPGSSERTKSKGDEEEAQLYRTGTIKDFMVAAEDPTDSVNLLDLPISQEVVPWPIE